MSSFPDVLSATLTYKTSGQNINATFTVPPEYAFAVVQVCLSAAGFNREGAVISTSHGNFSFDASYYQANTEFFKDFPILNLIIKGGESFSLEAGSGFTTATAKVAALCHKKPS